MTAASPLILEDNAIVQELTSLRSALTHYQHAADTAALQLQRRSLDVNIAFERQKQLEIENAHLMRELAVLTQNPDKTPHPATLSVSELTLAHRRLSERLSFTESVLLERTTELINATRKAESLVTYAERCREALSHGKEEEHALQLQVRNLEARLRATVEERVMVERALEDYAGLVRDLERKSGGKESPSETSPSPSSPVNSKHSISSSVASPTAFLDAGRIGLQRLLEEFNATTEALEREISKLSSEVEDLRIQLEVEQESREEDRTRLAVAKVQLDQHMSDDRAAATLVSRYMKFSQTSIDLLQAALDSQRTRLEARIATLEGQNHELRKATTTAHSQAAKLRDVLDELTEDISRESHGRRREVALRLKAIAREEQSVTLLRQMQFRMQEGLQKFASTSEGRPELDLLGRVFQDVTSLIDSLDGEPADMSSLGLDLSEEGSNGSLARVISCQETVTGLVMELQMETEKRLLLEKRVGDLALEQKRESLSTTASKEFPATPSDLGFGDSKEIIIDKAIVVHPITPIGAGAIPSSPVARNQPPSTYLRAPILQPITRPNGVSHLVSPDLPTVPFEEEMGPPAGDSDLRPGDPSQELFVPRPVLPLLPIDSSPRVINGAQLSQTVELSHSPTESQPDLAAQNSAFGANNAIDSETSSSTEASYKSPHSDPPLEDRHLDLDSIVYTLGKATARYDAISKIFRNCNTTLSRLRIDFLAIADSIPTSPSNISLLRTYMERLTDFLEDSRVELEIRIADEARLAKGFETILAVKGLAGDEQTSETMEKIIAFVSGSDPTIVKATETFHRKASDLEHDIALLKRSVHDMTSVSSMTQDLTTPASVSASWSWTGLVSSPNRSRPTSPAPTFGSVMTQRSPTTSRLNLQSPSDIMPQSQNLADLPFRIAMPRPIHPTTIMSSNNSSRISLSASPTLSPLASRPRTFSGAGLPNPLNRRISSGLALQNRLPLHGMRSASSGLVASSPAISEKALPASVVHEHSHLAKSVDGTTTEAPGENAEGNSDVE